MYIHVCMYTGARDPIYINIYQVSSGPNGLKDFSDDVSLQLRICTRKESKAVRLEAIVDPQVHGPI
jgi:hypothetical protein